MPEMGAGAAEARRFLIIVGAVVAEKRRWEGVQRLNRP